MGKFRNHLLAGAASAAPQANGWAGPYAGVSIGRGGAGFDNTFRVHEVSDDPTGADSVDLSGVSAGVQLGWRGAVGRLTPGVEIDAELATTKGSDRAISCPASLCFIDNTTRQTDRARALGSLKATLGYAAGDWLPYAVAGVALGKFRGEGTVGNAYGQSDFSYAKQSLGWLAGAGLERRIGSGWSLKAEYDHFTFAPFTELAQAGALGETRVKIHASVIKTGLNWRF